MNVVCVCVWVCDSETEHYGRWFVSGCQCRSCGDTIALFIACPDRGHWPSSHLCHLAAFMQDTGKRAERKWGMERWRKGELEEEKERDGWGRLPEGWSISVIGVIREISHITGWWFRQFRMGRTNAGIQACQMLKHSKFAAPLAVCTYNSTEMDAWWITGNFTLLGALRSSVILFCPNA